MGLWKLEMVFKQLYGGGRCLELHVQGMMSARMLLTYYIVFSKFSAGQQRVLVLLSTTLKMLCNCDAYAIACR